MLKGTAWLPLLAGLSWLALVAPPAPAADADVRPAVVIVPRSKAPSGSKPSATVSLKFTNVDGDDVLRFLAEATGKTVYREPSARFSVTLQNQTAIPVAEAIRLTQSVFKLAGFTLTETERSLIVVHVQPVKRGGKLD